MPDTVTIRYERDLDHPLDEAFDWLTDYRDDDADRAGAIIQDRKVVERGEDRIVLDGELETMGRVVEGRAEVELDPPDTWTAHLYDRKDRPTGTYRYHLEEDGEGCHLVVDYEMVAPKLRHKAMLWLGKPLVRRRLDDMWAGFEEAMDRELGDGEPA